VDHRRTITRRAFVPPVWLIVLALGAVVVGAAAVGWLAWDETRGDDPVAQPSATATTEPSPEPTADEPSPEPSETVPPAPLPEPTPTTPAADRGPGVSILNGTSINGLAAEASSFLGDLGWGDIRTGDTGGSYPENTVYYPPQLESQAQTLAADLGITRIRPAVDGMRDDRLTAVLVSRPSSLS
jgi:hypothetical protein